MRWDRALLSALFWGWATWMLVSPDPVLPVLVAFGVFVGCRQP